MYTYLWADWCFYYYSESIHALSPNVTLSKQGKPEISSWNEMFIIKQRNKLRILAYSECILSTWNVQCSLFIPPLFLASLWRTLPRTPLPPLPPSASGESCCQVSLLAFRRQKRCLRVTQAGECQPPRDTQVTLQNIHLLSQRLCS